MALDRSIYDVLRRHGARIGAFAWKSGDLPEYYVACDWCEGRGKYEQSYTLGCGMGSAHMVGTCGCCDGLGFVHRQHCVSDPHPVPASVLNQVLVAKAARVEVNYG